jgi:TonB family protein
MIWNPRKRVAALLPLLVAILTPWAGSAQEPAQPLQPQPPRYLLGGVEPLLNDQMKVVETLAAGRWREARTLAHQQFHVLAGYADDYPATAATGLALAALADAGLGDESLALCRWEAAQKLDPKFAQADFSSFGEAGAVLTRHRAQAPLPGVSAASPETARTPEPIDATRLGPEVRRPEILSKTPPEYPLAARKERLEGTVIVESIIGKDGRVLHARILQTQPKGLGLAALDAVCQWRFKPATLKGEPVKVYYVLTVNFKIEKTPVPPALPQP